MAVDARVVQRRVFVAAELQDGVVHLRVVENADGEKQLEVIDAQTRDALEQLRLQFPDECRSALPRGNQ